MKSSFLASTTLGKEVQLEYFSLETESFIPAIGGTLILKVLNDSVPPINCNHLNCDEFAEVLVIFVASAVEAGDSACCLCQDHCEELVEDNIKKVPYQILH